MKKLKNSLYCLLSSILLISCSQANLQPNFNMRQQVRAFNNLQPAFPDNPNESVDRTLAPLVESGKFTGIMAGVINGPQKNIYKYGKAEKNDKVKLDENTIFEIASITKIFTATLLADLHVKNRLKIDDPLEKFVPSNVRVPSFQGEKILLFQLAAHVSGLPAIPEDLDKKPGFDPYNPFANYYLEDAYHYLSNYQLTQNPDETKGFGYYEYSNFATSLLGSVLSEYLGLTYERAVKSRIFDPLGMNNSAIYLTTKQKSRLAQGYLEGTPRPPSIDSPFFVPMGSIRSTLTDMLTFLEASIGVNKSPLDTTLTFSHIKIFPDLIGLGWHLSRTKDGRVIFWHNGGAPDSGFSSFIGFIEGDSKGVVLLSNTFSWEQELTQKGFQILNEL